ncbi:otogelin-like [Acipenser ruthenus]|uniref:otogelin-like n=1 Tax=Acipenser ruthenus TaxID=7906 RepID=UPI0027427811|nr:otogelin-like [Acipenser ruthenus]
MVVNVYTQTHATAANIKPQESVPNVGYERDMICRTWGQYNYETFDGLYYYFPGKCTYTLVRECGEETEPSFVIQVHNDPECHSSAYSCSRSVSLFFPVEAELRLNRYNVTYNGQSIQLPHIVHDVEVERISQYTLVTLQHAFTLAWDGSTSSVYIKMSPEYVGRTCGLCGNFNADVHDDLKTSYDLFTHDTAIFGNSWMEMVPHEYSCPSVPANYPSPCLTQNYETRQKVQEMCILLLETPFKECHDLVSPFPFMASCSNDLCIAGPDNQVLCQALTEYARACAHAEHPLYDWRAAIPMCAVECDDKFIYRECITCCPVSCKIDKMCIDSKLQCLDGCYCPEDLIYDNGSCVKASECPCEYHGMLYSPGQEVQDKCNSCTCMGGSWNCTEYSCPGECSVTGDIHFDTFDGRVYTFQATCQYILAKSRSTGKFTISLQNAPCGANLDGACIQSVNIIVDEDPMKQITVNNIGEVYVSNLYRITPPYSDGVFQIHELSSMFLQVKTEDGLRLQYNWKELRLYLQVDESWKEDTVGLCGTFNGNIQDDFLSPAGMIESTPQLFGNSWKLSSACVPGHSIPQLDPCDIHQQAASYASEMCEILNKELFAPCHGYLSPAPFYQQCKSDTCKCGETCLCAALAHYARQCRKHGVVIDFRAHVSECAAQCQETMEYGTCISSCNSNCRSLSLSEDCGEECVEGCVCPGGTYYNSKSQKCVQKNECSCNFLGAEYGPGDIIMMSSGAQICKDGQMMYQGPSLDTKCPPGQFYFKCSDSLDSSTVSKGVACERTCESHLLNLTCSGHGHCVSGCICPPGFLKHGDECFEPIACPCLWKGKEYYPGDKVTSPCHNCVCQHGSFQCIFHPCPSMCTAYGDRHYRTFDGLLFDYIGACKVYLVKSNIDLTMSVAAENVDCYESGVICRKSLLINIGRSFIVFDNDSGKPNPSSLIDKRQPVFIWQAGYYTIVHIPTEDVTVLWDRKTTIHIQVGPRWQGKLTGLCGNFDLKTVNEMRSPENIESATAQEFGNSWTAAECVNSPDIRNPCSMNPLREPFAKRECGILLSEVFQACHPVVDVTWFYMNCLTDTCGCNRGGDCECFCTSVSAYAHRCCQQGITVDWRSPTVCPYDCEFYNKVLGKGPYKLVTYLESETVLAAHFSGAAAFPVQGAVSIPGVAVLFMLTPGLSRSKPHDTTLVSLEAAERPNYFLHLGPNGYLRVTKWEESDQFQEASTFIIHKDTWLAGYDSFESYMKPGFFVHYMLSSIHLMKYNHSVGFRQATLFKLEEAEFPSHSTCQWRYDACVSACFRTCSDPAGEACNTIPKVEGCMPQCPHNMVLDEVTQRCVYLEDCIKPAVAVEPITPQSTVSTPGAVTSPSVNATVSLGSTLSTAAPIAAARTTTETQRTSPTPTSSTEASFVMTISPKPLGPTIQTTPGDTTESLFTTITTLAPDVTKPEGAVTFSPTVSNLTLVTESLATTAKTPVTSTSIPISTSELQTTPSSPYTTRTTTESTTASSAAGAFLQTTTTKPPEISKVTTISVVPETELLPTVDWTSSAIETPSKATTVLTSTSPRPLEETEKTTVSTAEVTGLPAYTTTSKGPTKQPGTSRVTETSSATVAPTTMYIDTSTKVADKTVSPLTTKSLTSESTVYSSPFKTVKTSAYTTPETKSPLTTEAITSKSTVYPPPVETGKTTLTSAETTPQLPTELTTSKSPGYSPPVETGKTTLTTVETKPQLSTQLTTSKSPGYSPPVETGKTTYATMKTKPPLFTESTTSKSTAYVSPLETVKTTVQEIKTPLTTKPETSESTIYVSPFETEKTTASTTQLTVPESSAASTVSVGPTVSLGTTAYPSAYTQTTVGPMTEKTTSSFPTKLTTTTKTTAYPTERVETTPASAVPLASTETGRTTQEVPPTTIASTETSSSTHQVGVETTKTTTSASTKETTAETVASTSAELTKTTLTTLHTVDKVDTNITTLGTTTVYPFLTELSKTTLEPTKSETTVSVTPYSVASEKVWTTITSITSSAVSKSITSSTTPTYPSSTEHTAETTTTGYIFSTKPVTHPSITPPLTSEEFVSTVATVSSLPQLTTSKTTTLYQTLPDGTSLTTGYPTEKTSTGEHSAKPATPYPDTAAETVQSSSTTSQTSSTTLIKSSTTRLQTVTSQTMFTSEPTTTATTRSVFSTIKSTAGTTPGRESKHTPFSSGTTMVEAPVLLSTTAQLLGSTLSTSKVTTSSETVQTPETSTLSSLTTSQLKTEVTNATAFTGKEGVSTVPPKQEVSTTLLSASSESHAATPAVTLRTTGTSQVTPETVSTVTTTSPAPKPTLGTTLHTTTLSTSSTETPKEKWTTIGKTPTEEVTVSTTIVPLSTATTLLIYSPVTASAVTTAATTASIRTEKQTTQAVTPSKPVTTASVTTVLNATVLTTTGKETTTFITTAAQTSTMSTYKTTPLPETSTGQTTKQPASTLESTAATTRVTPNATTAAESLRTTSSEYWLTTSKKAVSNITVSVLSTVSPTSSPPATTAETESSSVSGPSVSTSTSYTNATEYWSTQTTTPLLSSNETLTPLSPQSTSAHTTTTLVTSTKMCTPQYSEIIDDCTKYVCMNGQLMLFNKSQNCPYNATPPNCGLLGFAILVNGDKCCPQWDCPCRCSVFPDLNIITFDGNSVAIYKAASYIVTQLPNETVSIQVQECQSSDTLLWNFTNLCLVALNITHKAHQVLIDRLQRRLYVNSRYARPRFKKNGFEILDTGNMYLIKTPAGLKIQWFHSTGMMVIETDSPSHKLTTMGLCGCCDGDPTNDLTLFNGTTVSESEDPTVFIDSWQVPNTTSFMGQNRRREVNCSTSDCSECLSMLSNQTFSSCHAFVPPKMFCEVWVRDAEYVKSPCTALAAYVAACHKFSICIEWRSPDYCSFMCPPELRYQACLPACNAKTCPNHEFDSDPEECSGLTEGCVCPEGTVLHRPYSALCIPSEKCACTDSFGTPHASGEVWKASKDGCCMYKCDNDSIIPVEHNCTKVPEPVCSKAGEVTVSLADDKSCCPQKACVCNQTLCDQYAPECKYGEKLVSYYRDYSCCPDYICECDPDRCESDIPTCRDDQTLIATQTEGSCCMAYICMCGSCSDTIPTCQEGEVFTVDANSTDRCCPPYHCVCETYRCTEYTCPLGMSVVTVWSPDLCCPLNTCECACDTIPKPQCKLGEMLQIDNEFLADPENQCGCSKYKCVKEQVCVDGERGVMRPGQTLVEHTAEGICYTTQCTSHTDPVTSFYKIQVSRTNCTAQCEPNQVYRPPDDLTTCCGVCRNTSCIYQMDNGSIALYKPGTTWMFNCKTYECTDTTSGPTLISYSISCPPFNETECMKIGGTVISYMDGCCKTCKEDGKSCQKVTVRMTIRKNDCRSNRPVNIVSCDGKCPSASIYNYNINTYARFCKCCREIGLQRRSVQLYCSGNSTWVYYSIQEPTDCSCQWS